MRVELFPLLFKNSRKKPTKKEKIIESKVLPFIGQ